MKGTGKRVLSVSLSVLMALGMPSGTFAAAPDAEVAGQEREADITTVEPEVTGEVSQQVTEEPEVSEETKVAEKEETKQETTAEPKKEETVESAKQPSSTPKAEDKAETTVKTEEKELPEVKVAKTELIETKTAYLVTVYTDSEVYDQLYIGKKEDTEKQAVVAGKKAPNGQYAFQFAVDADKLGTRLQVVPGVKASGEWYTKKDVFCEIPEGTKTEAKGAEIATYAEPSGETTAEDEKVTEEDAGLKAFHLDGDKAGSTYSMFTVHHSTVKEDGDMVDVVLYVSKKPTSVTYTYDAIYIGNKNDEIKENLVLGEIAGEYQKYAFRVSKEVFEQGIEFVPRRTSNQAFYTTTSLVLKKEVKPSGIPDSSTEPKPSTEPEPSDAPKPSEAPDPTVPTPENFKNIQVIKEDGSQFKMFKRAGSEVQVNGDKLIVSFETDNTNFDKVYFGKNDDLEKTPVTEGARKENDGWKFRFTFDKEQAGTVVPVVLGKTDGTWYTNMQLYMVIPEVSEEKPTNPPTGEPTTTPTATPTPTNPSAETRKDGIYSTTASTGKASMFKVMEVKLTIKNGEMTALITLSGEGYDYLYMGTGAEAAKKDSSQWIKYNGTSNYAEGKTGRTYEIPVSALDTDIAVASHSERQGKWYDRTITFSSSDLKWLGDLTSDAGKNNGSNTSTGNKTANSSNKGSNTTKTDSKPDTESKSETDTSGSTKKVNNSTKLKDGVYKPDKFTWSGGTGKVNIMCDKVTIKNGQALATIVFSSDAYQYVKANGNKYLPTHTNGTSVFVIPVELNKNNSIIGMTTRMSTAHEITYSILVYLAAADASGDGRAAANSGDNNKLDETAPSIIGLEYKSETKLDYAKYFKIYHYDKDVTLLEIDMTKDTDNDPEKLKEKDSAKKSGKKSDSKKTTKDSKTSTKKTADKTKTAGSDEEGEKDKNIGKSQEEITADLYKGNVVKYLIVPKDSDVELPTGIEKEMIVVQLPIKKAYVDSEEALSTMEDLNLLKKVKAVGYDQDETDIDAVNEALEEESMIYAGGAEDPEFRQMVKNKIDFAIVSSEILPGSKTEQDLKEKQEKEEQSGDKKTAAEENKASDSSDTADDTDTKETSVLENLADNFATLDIPMLIDRSADEETELAKAEWLKAYGALFGCSKKTDKLYNKTVKAAESKKK